MGLKATVKALASGISLAIGLSFNTAAASDYPNKPIKLIAPIAVGGLTDTLARLVATGLSDYLKQPVIVENRPGAGGVLGMEAAANSPSDGYTIILVYQGVAAVNTSLYKNLPYDTMRDFTAVAGLASFPMVLVTHPNKGPQSISDFVVRAKENPDEFSYASAGNATTSHLTMELFKKEAGIDALHVPYKGESPANADVVGGQVDIAFSSLASIIPLVQAKRLEPLGIGTTKRSSALPNVPTIAESGYPGFEAVGWYGLLAPIGTPEKIVAKLSIAVSNVMNLPDTQKKLSSLGVNAEPLSPSEFSQKILKETAKWKDVIEKAGIKVD